jgi:hypothetical protein
VCVRARAILYPCMCVYACFVEVCMRAQALPDHVHLSLPRRLQEHLTHLDDKIASLHSRVHRRQADTSETLEKSQTRVSGEQGAHEITANRIDHNTGVLGQTLPSEPPQADYQVYEGWIPTPYPRPRHRQQPADSRQQPANSRQPAAASSAQARSVLAHAHEEWTLRPTLDQRLPGSRSSGWAHDQRDARMEKESRETKAARETKTHMAKYELNKRALDQGLPELIHSAREKREAREARETREIEEAMQSLDEGLPEGIRSARSIGLEQAHKSPKKVYPGPLIDVATIQTPRSADESKVQSSDVSAVDRPLERHTHTHIHTHTHTYTHTHTHTHTQEVLDRHSDAGLRPPL